MKDIIVTDLNIGSYATNLTVQHSQDNNDEPTAAEGCTIKTSFANLVIGKLGVSIVPCDIIAIHVLPSKLDGSWPFIMPPLYADKRTEPMRKRSVLQGTECSPK